jgi:hypothetical protein
MNIREKNCANCAHFEKKDYNESLNWSSDRYICNFHKLSNGELCDPLSQGCPQHYSIISKLRDDKLEELGI